MNRDLTGKPPLSRTDKLCLVVLAGVLVSTTLVYELTDGRTIRAAAEPSVSQETLERIPPQVEPMVFRGETPNTELLPLAPDDPLLAVRLVKTVEARREELYWEAVPLDEECQTALREACEAHGVPVSLALGVIETESGFGPNADNGLCYGYMGLNRNYYPPDLTPAENIRAGVAHLAGQIERYGGDIQAALRGYNKGWDDGDRRYAKAVLAASEKWGCG